MEDNQKKVIYTKEYFYELDASNKLCCDCKCPYPAYISVNIAVTLCGTCASKHIKLGYNISYIRDMNNDWDNYLLTYILLGGNAHFQNFCSEHNIYNLPLELKYTTKIVEYYRLLLKSQVLNTEPPKQIDFPTWNEPCDVNKNNFPEFMNYQIDSQQGLSTAEIYKRKMMNVFGTIGDGVSGAAKKVTQTFKETDFKEKFSEGYEKTKEIGGAVYDKTAPVIKSVASKTMEGIGFLWGKVTGSS